MGQVEYGPAVPGGIGGPRRFIAEVCQDGTGARYRTHVMTPLAGGVATSQLTNAKKRAVGNE